jgi:pyrimidine deaminase RibD-like protein
VLLIALGNASTRLLLATLAEAWTSLSTTLASPDVGAVILERDRVVMFPRR